MSLLRVLMLVDTVSESDMLARELRQTGFELAMSCATTEAAYLAALESPLDLILADAALPAFDALHALQILRTSELDIPLIVVTDLVGEASAIECVRLGATDFVFKDRPARLGSVVVRALAQRALRAHARAAEVALRESEERFRSAYDYAAIGMALVGLDGGWLQANRALCDFTGYTESELLATTFQAITHPDDLAIDLSNVRLLVAGEIPSYQMEKRYLHKDGATIWALLSVSLVRDALRQPRYFISQIQDITQRKQTDAARALLAAIVDSSDDAIIGVALDGIVLSWNSGAKHLYGYRADQMIGQPIAILRPPHEQEEAAQMYERLGRGESTTQIETVRLRNDGQLIDVALTTSAITDASGAISGFSTISRDISVRKRDDRLLRQKTAFIQLFQEVAVAANQVTSLEQALQTAVDAICIHIGWPLGHVYLPDPDMPGGLLPTSIWHLDDAQRFATFRSITEAVRLAPGIGLPGQVVASRKPAWLADIILDFSTPRTRVIQESGVRAGFALPVVVDDNVVAVLEFFATEVIEPDAAMLDVLQHVGTQLGRVVERMRAEAALRESEERFRVLFAHSPDAIVLLDLHHPDLSWPIVECNDVACRMNGYTRDELIGQPIDLLNDTAGSRAERATYLEQIRRDGKIRFDGVHRRKDGSLFPIEVVSSLIMVAGRELVMGIDRDISERKRAEDALRTAEAQYRTLVEQLPAIVYTAKIDQQSSTSYVSPQVETILGFSPEEWLARPGQWIEQVHPDDRAHVLEAVHRTQTSGTPVSQEYRAFTRDGRLIWLRDAARVVRDDADRPLFIHGITLDITERKLAEDALRTAEAQYRTLVEQIPAIIYTAEIDSYSTTRYVSPQIEAILGFTPAEWLADPDLWLQQVHPDDRQRMLESVGHAHASDQSLPVEFRSYTRDGRIVWLRDAARVVRDDAGQPLFMQGITLDITESKQAETALRLSETRHRALINAMPDMLFRLDKAGVYLDYTEDSRSDLLQLPPDLRGKKLADVLPPDVTRAMMACIDRAFATGLAQVVEYQLVLPKGIREFEARIVICGADEVLVIVRNITERKQIERMKNEFVATVSHELRTPLTSIRGALGLIAGGVAGAVPPNVQRMVDIACTNSDRLIRLINDILDIEKIESGNLAFALQPFALLPLVAQAIEANRAYGAQFNVTFTLDDLAHDRWVNVDSDRLIQALTNLLANAAKFSPPGGTVLVRVSRNADMLQVAISDQGPGIPAAFRDRLFQKFAQADSSTTREKGGTGLGLSITKAIIERLGGQIACAPNQRGATFVIDLPAWHMPTPDAADALALPRVLSGT
ncbi:MAG: PAS domain S-box protein [Roseiflexaceae bacterium]